MVSSTINNIARKKTVQRDSTSTPPGQGPLISDSFRGGSFYGLFLVTPDLNAEFPVRSNLRRHRALVTTAELKAIAPRRLWEITDP